MSDDWRCGRCDRRPDARANATGVCSCGAARWVNCRAPGPEPGALDYLVVTAALFVFGVGVLTCARWLLALL